MGDRILSMTEESPTVEAVNRSKRLAAAFGSVFGQPGLRSSNQTIVRDHLRKCCGRDGPVFTPDAQGRFDPLRAAQIDGAQTQYLIIKRQLQIASRQELEKPKPKTKK